MDQDSVRRYLQRMIDEYDLRVANGDNMSPEIASIMAMVLIHDKRLEEMMTQLQVVAERLEEVLKRRRCCWWVAPAAEAVMANKAAAGLVLTALLAVLSYFLNSILKSGGK